MVFSVAKFERLVKGWQDEAERMKEWSPWTVVVLVILLQKFQGTRGCLMPEKERQDITKSTGTSLQIESTVKTIAPGIYKRITRVCGP